MNKNILLVFCLICLTIFASCQDRKHIVVIGQVIDELTGKPIPNAEVVVLCWYMSNIDDASFNKQTLRTDKSGNYKAFFEEGHQIDVAAKAKGYQPTRCYNELEENEIEVTLKLAKQQTNSTLKALLTTDEVVVDSKEDPTFLRVRIYAGQDGKALNFRNVETFGFDFKTQTTSSDTLQTDLWFRTIKKEQQPTIIATAQNGGIIPILDKDVKSSLLFEKNVAPTTGYRTTYQLTGEEAGFFILCRDGKTYGKIILEESSNDKSFPDSKGSYYKEFGKNFSCLYQPNGTTDLAYPKTDIDLEDFLIDNRYR